MEAVSSTEAPTRCFSAFSPIRTIAHNLLVKEERCRGSENGGTLSWTQDLDLLEPSIFTSNIHRQCEGTVFSSEGSSLHDDGISGDRSTVPHETRVSAELELGVELEKTDSPHHGRDIAHGSAVQPTLLSHIPDNANAAQRNDRPDACSNGDSTSRLRISDCAQLVPARVPTVSSSHGEESSSALTKRRMRAFMRRVPQAVTLVTATDTRAPGNPWRGVTISSFTTVTFEPEVIVSFNLKLPSATFDAIQSSSLLDVNMLKSNERGAETASQFARGHAASSLSNAPTEATSDVRRSRKGLSRVIPPSLADGKDGRKFVSFHIQCSYMPEKTVQLGDHVVIFATVKEIPDRGFSRFPRKDDMCLAYIDGRYGQIKPFSKQPQERPVDLNVPKNRSTLHALLKKSTMSRHDILRIERLALEGSWLFKKGFLSEADLVDLRQTTISLVRRLRFHSKFVFRAISRFSHTINSSSMDSSGPSAL